MTEQWQCNPGTILRAYQELARLANQTRTLQSDFAAGRLTNTHITYIIIAAVAIVLIIALAAS